MEKKTNFPLLPRVTGGTGKPLSSKRSGQQGERETRKRESRVKKHRGIGATWDRTLDSVSRALVLGALPLVLPMRPIFGRRSGIFFGIAVLAPKVRETHNSWKDFRSYAKQGNFGVIGKSPQSKRERGKEARGCEERSREHGSYRRKGKLGRKDASVESGVCKCGFLDVPRHGGPRAVHAPPHRS